MMRFISIPSELTEADISGVSLEGQAPEALKIAKLKFLTSLSRRNQRLIV